MNNETRKVKLVRCTYRKVWRIEDAETGAFLREHRSKAACKDFIRGMGWVLQKDTIQERMEASGLPPKVVNLHDLHEIVTGLTDVLEGVDTGGYVFDHEGRHFTTGEVAFVLRLCHELSELQVKVNRLDCKFHDFFDCQ